jgi:Ca2+-binding EF-hand superfamily protein
MLHGLSTSAASSAKDLTALFKKLDTNSDNSVSRSEFVVGRPDDVSEDQAGTLFDTLDGSGSGSLGQDAFTSAFGQMSGGMQSVLLQAQESGQRGGGQPDAAKMLEDLDSDGDGTVTRSEFVAGRPKDVSEDQAGAFFDKIASAAGADSSSGLGQDQLASGLDALGPPPPPPPGGDSSSTSDSTDSTDTENQLLQQLLALLQQSQTSAGTSQGAPDSSKMFEDLDSDGDGTVTRAEFVAGRPKDVSEDQAGSFYDRIASAAGTESSSGLNQDQLADGMKKAGPPPDDATQSASSQPAATDQLLQELLKAIGSYQKANLLSAANTSLAA